MNKIYKNWFVHNIFGHSISELLYWVLLPFSNMLATRASRWFHDVTCPSTRHNDEGQVASYEKR